MRAKKATFTATSVQSMIHLFGFVGSFNRGYRRKFALNATHGGSDPVGVFGTHVVTFAGKKPRESVGKKPRSNR